MMCCSCILKLWKCVCPCILSRLLFLDQRWEVCSPVSYGMPGLSNICWPSERRDRNKQRQFDLQNHILLCWWVTYCKLFSWQFLTHALFMISQPWRLGSCVRLASCVQERVSQVPETFHAIRHRSMCGKANHVLSLIIIFVSKWSLHN
jgi:hypothetical protein